jgi:hypothetical protein
MTGPMIYKIYSTVVLGLNKLLPDENVKLDYYIEWEDLLESQRAGFEILAHLVNENDSE